MFQHNYIKYIWTRCLYHEKLYVGVEDLNSEKKGVISESAKIPSIAIDSFDESLDEINGTVHETLNLVMKAVTCKSELQAVPTISEELLAYITNF